MFNEFDAKIAHAMMEIPPGILQALWQIIPSETTADQVRLWYTILRHMYRKPINTAEMQSLRDQFPMESSVAANRNGLPQFNRSLAPLQLASPFAPDNGFNPQMAVYPSIEQTPVLQGTPNSGTPMQPTLLMNRERKANPESRDAKRRCHHDGLEAGPSQARATAQDSNYVSPGTLTPFAWADSNQHSITTYSMA
jgi:hypothetical protein